MSLRSYFEGLIAKVESSDLHNNGKDKDGFFLPTRTVALRHLNLLLDLHEKPRAKPMVKASWSSVVELLPPEWLKLAEPEKTELKKLLE